MSAPDLCEETLSASSDFIHRTCSIGQRHAKSLPSGWGAIILSSKYSIGSQDHIEPQHAGRMTRSPVEQGYFVGEGKLFFVILYETPIHILIDSLLRVLPCIRAIGLLSFVIRQSNLVFVSINYDLGISKELQTVGQMTDFSVLSG